MNNSDNPILNTIKNVLGLDKPPASFSEKVDALHRSLNQPDLTYPELMRREKTLTSMAGSLEARTLGQANSLHAKLYRAGLVPETALGVFQKSVQNGGSIFYNSASKALYYHTGDRVTSLPVGMGQGLLSLGGTQRRANDIFFGPGETMSALDAYYHQAYAFSVGARGRGEMHAALDRTNRFTLSSIDPRFPVRLNSLLGPGTSIRGVLTPEEGFWTANRQIVPYTPTYQDLFRSRADYKTALSAEAMLIRTTGRSIFTGLKELDKSIKDYRGAITAIDRYKERYFQSLSDTLTGMGDPFSYAYIKPEFLGQHDKFMVAGKELARTFGSSYLEEHSLQKGLYQLAKLRRTTGSQMQRMMEAGDNPFSYYGVQGIGDIRGSMRLKVAVVDTTTEMADRLLFQESGSLLTERGAAKFSFRAPMGSAKFSSPSDKLIGTIERLYGINLGDGYQQTMSKAANFTQEEFRYFSSLSHKQMKSLGKLTEREFDIWYLGQAANNRRMTGLMDALSAGNLGKVSLTDSSLTLDFITKQSMLPGTTEAVVAGRRASAQLMEQHHALRGIIPKHVLEGVDAVMSSAEFYKTMGAQVYLTNFIEQVSQLDNAEEYLGRLGKIKQARGMKRKTIIPMITDFDSAFEQSQKIVQEIRDRKTIDAIALADRIEHGAEVALHGMARSGVSGIRIFGMSGAIRTDFMGDINLHKPAKYTASKMMTIASGHKALGYKNAYADPMFALLASMNHGWRSGSIGIDDTGGLFLGKKNAMRAFSTALMGDSSLVNPRQVVSIAGDGTFSLNNRALASLPSDMSLFYHGNNGLSRSALRKTILGKSQEMLYLDLGREMSLDLLGTGARKYRYLPVPLKYLRSRQGVHGQVVIGKNHASHDFIRALIQLQSSTNFNGELRVPEEALRMGYTSLLKNMAGNKGIFNKSNTILSQLGGRARLAPQGANYFTAKSWDSTSDLFTAYISEGDFEDFLRRKVGAASGKGIQALRDQVRDSGHFYGMLSADPLQRSEHANVFKFVVDKSRKAGSGIGQLNMHLHPLVFRMLERDVDRDPILFSSLSHMDLSKIGGSNNAEIQAALRDRIARQEKLMQHFMWFSKYESMKPTDKPAARRLLGMNMGKLDNLIDYLKTYIGVPKSRGYSLYRSTDTIMSTIIARGAKGAKDLGILSKSITPDMIDTIVKPFKDDPILFDTANKLMQNMYQSAVQKAGKSKDAMWDLSKSLINIGHKYKGTAFDVGAVHKEAKAAIYDFLTAGESDRTFMAMDYLAGKGLMEKPQVSMIKADLERGTREVLDAAAVERLRLARHEVADMASDALAHLLGPGAVLAGSVRKAPKSIAGIIRKTIKEDITAEELISSVVSPASGIALPRAKKGLTGTMLDEARKGLEPGAASKLKTWLSTNHGAFSVGAAVGALAAAAIVSSMGGPEAPMPRAIDVQQPMDYGPDVYRSPPTVYSSNQSFYASQRRSPETFSPVSTYSFPGMNDNTVILRDKQRSKERSSLINKSDYTY